MQMDCTYVSKKNLRAYVTGYKKRYFETNDPTAVQFLGGKTK